MRFIFVTEPDSFDATIRFYYYLAEPQKVQFEIMSINGKYLLVLESGLRSKGDHFLLWSADNLPDGIYLAKFHAGEETIIQNVSIIKQENIAQ